VSEFDAATAVQGSAGHWLGAIATGWDIAGFPNGGYVMSVGLQAMLNEVGQPDPLTVTAHFLAPVATGPVETDVEVARRGRRHDAAAAVMRQSEREVVRLLGTFADLERASGPELITALPPALPPPEECIGTDAGEPAMPVPPIAERVEVRLNPDHVGFALGSPHGIAEISGWERFADGRQPDPLSLAVFSDALPPAVFNASLPMAWVPTVELTLHVRKRPPPGWLAASFRSRFIFGGYLEEDGDLWSENGELIALSRQLALTPRVS
jgi:acyl-CoA thioesterase